jgi:hypothetical protein
MIADYYQIYPNNNLIGTLILIALPLIALLYTIFRASDYITYYGAIKKTKRYNDNMIADMKKKIEGNINTGLNNPISQEKMVLPIIEDIFDDNVRYEISPNQITLFRSLGKFGLFHQMTTDTFKAEQDNNDNSDMVKAFRIIQKTRNEGYELRQGMFNFLNAYLQAFLNGNYRDLANNLLGHDNKPKFRIKCPLPNCFHEIEVDGMHGMAHCNEQGTDFRY